jgi:sec-independent protein translocase protein TatA
LLLILIIILVIFGGSRLRNLGSDLGSAIRSFGDAMKEGSKSEVADGDLKSDLKKIEQQYNVHKQDRTAEINDSVRDQEKF